MQRGEQTIAAIMRPPAHTILPSTPAEDARRMFLAESYRSLIVVDNNRPIGIVSWAELEDLNVADQGQTVADFMTRNPTAVNQNATLSDARAMLESTDHDLIAVVDQQGTLVGEALRLNLLDPENLAPSATATPATTSGEDADVQLQIERGMKVVGAHDEQVGAVEDVTKDAAGRITHVDVTSGHLLKHHKRIPVDMISHIDGDTVHVTFDKEDFKRLPDAQ
jgi:CBS-domain-containing membrane protein